MCKYSRFRAYIVLFHIVGNIMLAESSNLLEQVICSNAPSTDDPLSNLVTDIPTLTTDSILLKPNVPICDCEEQSLSLKTLINQAQNSYLFEPEKPNTDLAPCENNAKILAELLGFCPEQSPNCDISLSFLVFLLSRRNGKMVVVGQGIRLSDCSILAVYGVTQMAKEGLWVEYPDGVIKEVVCMKQLKSCSRNILSQLVYTVQLVVELGSCTDCSFTPPKIQSCEGSLLLPAYYVQRDNCDSITYRLSTIFALVVLDPTGLATSFAILDKPNDLCGGFQGGVFITQDGKVLGFAVAKPIVAANLVLSIPGADKIAIQCVVPFIPYEC